MPYNLGAKSRAHERRSAKRLKRAPLASSGIVSLALSVVEMVSNLPICRSLAHLVALMTDNDHLLQLLRETLAQCQMVRDVWRENEFRLIVAGLDITDAECAAFETRISHLKNLIAAIDKEAASEPGATTHQ